MDHATGYRACINIKDTSKQTESHKYESINVCCYVKASLAPPPLKKTKVNVYFLYQYIVISKSTGFL